MSIRKEENKEGRLYIDINMVLSQYLRVYGLLSHIFITSEDEDETCRFF